MYFLLLPKNLLDIKGVVFPTFLSLLSFKIIKINIKEKFNFLLFINNI